MEHLVAALLNEFSSVFGGCAAFDIMFQRLCVDVLQRHHVLWSASKHMH